MTPLIIALDFSTQQQALNLLEQLDPDLCRVKIGKEMFTAFGPQFVQLVVARGFDVFLDLKFHDIPNTVAAACRAAADLGVWMLNVHALGGKAMLQAAASAVSNYSNNRPKLIAVTILTSMDNAMLADVGLVGSLMDNVKRLSQLAADTGLDGVVSSAQEAEILRRAHGDDFAIVTPGIRLQPINDDQRRTMTPRQALDAGASHLVIGRPVTRAANPMQVIQQIMSTLE